MKYLLLGLIPWDDILKQIDKNGIVLVDEEELRKTAAPKVRVAIVKMFVNFGLKPNFKNMEDILHSKDFQPAPNCQYDEPTGMRSSLSNCFNHSTLFFVPQFLFDHV